MKLPSGSPITIFAAGKRGVNILPLGLMGLYDERLSQTKLDQLAVTRRIEEITQHLRYLRDLLPSDEQKSTVFIKEQIETFSQEIRDITEQVKQLRILCDT